jgi:hypothetical protein
MKLEDLYKSELSDLRVEPKQDGYERVKTALVHRIVRNALIFSVAFVLFFVGLGELAKHKKSQANQEYKFPSKFYKKQDANINTSNQQVKEKIILVKQQNQKTINIKPIASNQLIAGNNPNFKIFENNWRPLNYVEKNRAAYFGQKVFFVEKNLLEKSGNHLNAFASFTLEQKIDFALKNNTSNIIDVNTENKLDENASLQNSLTVEKEEKTENSSFPSKKDRKIKFSIAAISGYNKTIQENDFKADPYYYINFGLVYPILSKKLNARLGVNLGDHNYRLKNEFAETIIKNYSIDFPVSIEHPIHLVGSSFFTIGIGTKVVNEITHKEKTRFSDGSTSTDNLYADTFKKNYFVFDCYGALNFLIKNVQVNLFTKYQPSFAREIALTGTNSIFNEYGVSSLQFGVGIDF